MKTLRGEFEADAGSFLLQLRCDLRWDKEAFSRWIAAMHSWVLQRSPDDPIPRWIAEGFWYLDTFVKDWSTHENFALEHADAYYERAYERLHDLAHWLFIGTSSYQEGAGFDPI